MALTNWLECNYLSFREKDSEFGGNVKKEVVFKGIRSFRILGCLKPKCSRFVPKFKSARTQD